MFPIIIETKYFTLNTFWLLFAIAIIAAMFTLLKLSAKNGLKIQFLSDHSLKIILLAIIGARIFSIIENFNIYFYEFDFQTLPRLFYIWDKGLNIWGAIIVIFVYLYFLCKKHEQDFFKWTEVIVPSMLVGFAIGHIGAFFEGINYGNETSLPWGVNFESPSVKYSVPIHPTQIYASVYSAILAFGLILLSKTEKIINLKKSGFIGILGVAIYAFFVFLEQFVRGDDGMMIFNIKLEQIVACIIAVATSSYLYYRFKKHI